MRLLADRLALGRRRSAPWMTSIEEEQQACKWTSEAIRSVPRFVISNVTEYLYAGTDKEEWETETAFPSLAPPFPSFWMETRAPSKIVSSEYGELKWDGGRPDAWGCFVDCVDPQDAQDAMPALADKIKTTGMDPRWITNYTLYVSHRDDPLNYIHLGISLVVAVHSDGSGIADHAVIVFNEDPGFTADQWTTLTSLIRPMLLAVSFMHCKNVKVVESVTPSRLVSSQGKKGRRPFFVKWNVLDIEPMKQVLRTEGRSFEVGIPRALHICRGHFKDYRQSGLFGKVKGIFWWDSNVRGSSVHGAVIKDYSVKSPEVVK